MAEDLPSDVVWPTAANQPASSLPDDIQWPSAPQTSPDTSWGNKLSRLGLGMAEPAVGIAQGAAHLTGYGTETMDQAANWLAQKEAEKKAAAGLTPQDTDWWTTGGNIASPINFVGGEGAVAASKALPWVGRAIEGSNIAKGAITGAGISASQPVTGQEQQDYGGAKLGQTATGAITGGVAAPVIGAASRIIAPNASKTAAQLTAEGADKAAIQHAADLELANREGIRLTGGQTGGFQRSESHVGDVPFAGSQYRDRLQDFREDANRAALNRAIPPGAQPIQPGEPIGTQGIAKLRNDFNDAYAAAHAPLSLSDKHPSFPQMEANLQNLVARSRKDFNLTGSGQGRLQQIIDDQNSWSDRGAQRNSQRRGTSARQFYAERVVQTLQQRPGRRQANAWRCCH